MILSYHKDFKKNYLKLSKRIQEKFDQRILLFQEEEFNPILNNHSLTGKYLGYRSINITGDLRALYQKKGDIVVFVSIDSHSNLYG